LITTLTYTSDGKTKEDIQIPGKQPVLPALLGADAHFIAEEDLLYQHKILDYSKLKKSQRTFIGYFYGGVEATFPTSGRTKPTYVNKKTYKVYLELK